MSNLKQNDSQSKNKHKPNQKQEISAKTTTLLTPKNPKLITIKENHNISKKKPTSPTILINKKEPQPKNQIQPTSKGKRKSTEKKIKTESWGAKQRKLT